MLNNLLVSVLMTAYNREYFIAEAIESVLASTYQNWELIICDDCSTDSTFEIVHSFASNDSRIRAFKNEKNLGDYPNRNRAASYAKGKYIVIVDSDDWMFKNALEVWVALMEKYQAAFGIFNNDYFSENTLLSAKESIKQHFFEHPVLMNGPGATVIKTEYFRKINGFPEKYGPANDMYYNLKAASQTATLFITIPLGDYRRHDGQEINNRYSYLYNNYRYLRDALAELDIPLSTSEKSYILHKNKRRFVVNLSSFLVKTGELSKAINARKLADFNWKDLADALINKKHP